MSIFLQTDFEALLDDLINQKKTMPKGEKLSVAAYLKNHGFLPHLEGINFSINEKTVSQIAGVSRSKSMSTVSVVPRRTNTLTDLDFSGCSIINCNFDFCDVSGSKYEGVIVSGCSFNNTVLNHCIINKTHFQTAEKDIRCTFIGASFDYSHVQSTVFQECVFSNCSFNALKKFIKVSFENCPMNHVSLIGSPAHEVSMRATPGTLSTISINSGKNKINLDHVSIKTEDPIILIPSHNVMPGVAAALTEKMLMARNLDPIRMDYNPVVDIETLDKEINILNQLTTTKINHLKAQNNATVAKKMNEKNETEEGQHKRLAEARWKKQGISFPMLLIEIMREDPAKYPQMAALYELAKSMYDSVDGIIIPGGQDIDPRFYGVPLHSQTILPKYNDAPQYTDPRRDVLEFSLVYLQQRTSPPKPLCGICRGSQVIAASYGGEMCQNIADEKRWAYFIEAITPHDNKLSSPDTMSQLSTYSRLVANEQFEALNVLFIHHQAYNLETAHGLVATASTVTASGIPIDIVAEHLQQNITMTQAHPEFAFDTNEQVKGVSSRVSTRAADSIFGQFEMRVRAFHNSKRLDMGEVATGVTLSSSQHPPRKMHGFYRDTPTEEPTQDQDKRIKNIKNS